MNTRTSNARPGAVPLQEETDPGMEGSSFSRPTIWRRLGRCLIYGVAGSAAAFLFLTVLFLAFKKDSDSGTTTTTETTKTNAIAMGDTDSVTGRYVDHINRVFADIKKTLLASASSSHGSRSEPEVLVVTMAGPSFIYNDDKNQNEKLSTSSTKLNNNVEVEPEQGEQKWLGDEVVVEENTTLEEQNPMVEIQLGENNEETKKSTASLMSSTTDSAARTTSPVVAFFTSTTAGKNTTAGAPSLSNFKSIDNFTKVQQEHVKTPDVNVKVNNQDFFDAVVREVQQSAVWEDANALLFPTLQYPTSNNAVGSQVVAGGILLTWNFHWTWGTRLESNTSASVSGSNLVSLHMGVEMHQTSFDRKRVYHLHANLVLSSFMSGMVHTDSLVFTGSGQQQSSSSVNFASNMAFDHGNVHVGGVAVPGGEKSSTSTFMQPTSTQPDKVDITFPEFKLLTGTAELLPRGKEGVARTTEEANHAGANALEQQEIKPQLQLVQDDDLHFSQNKMMFAAIAPKDQEQMTNKNPSGGPSQSIDQQFFDAFANHAKRYRWANPTVLLFPTLQYPQANSAHGSQATGPDIIQSYSLQWDWQQDTARGLIGLHMRISEFCQHVQSERAVYCLGGDVNLVKGTSVGPVQLSSATWRHQRSEQNRPPVSFAVRGSKVGGGLASTRVASFLALMSLGAFIFHLAGSRVKGLFML
ncbi:unnamed protein product [Amoebophrya sp. A25]|nr:unnamed protein product [Amoebophrya sp. A25]|eukprot:GSA25T00001417001.1